MPDDSNSDSEERLLKMKTMNNVEHTDKKTTTVVWPPGTTLIKSKSGVLLSNSLDLMVHPVSFRPQSTGPLRVPLLTFAVVG